MWRSDSEIPLSKRSLMSFHLLSNISQSGSLSEPSSYEIVAYLGIAAHSFSFWKLITTFGILNVAGNPEVKNSFRFDLVFPMVSVDPAPLTNQPLTSHDICAPVHSGKSILSMGGLSRVGPSLLFCLIFHKSLDCIFTDSDFEV